MFVYGSKIYLKLKKLKHHQILTSFVIQGVPRELTKSIGLLHRPVSIPGPFIMWEKFTDA
jgi:hypothetical protein